MTNSAPIVCVVDDDDAVRDSLHLLLESHGMTVHAFPGAQLFLDAFEKLAADCFVFDHHMQEMTGLELAEHLRERSIGTPIILISGRTDAISAHRMERAAVAAVFAKPVNVDDLIDKIEELQAAEMRTNNPSRH